MSAIAASSFLRSRIFGSSRLIRLASMRQMHSNGTVLGSGFKPRNCALSIECRRMSDAYYTKKHEYVVMESDTVGRVGISNYAQEKLGDVVYVQLPEVGQTVEKDDEIAAVESVKAASEIYSPVSGQISEINEALETDCALVNKSPMEKGWIFKLSLSRSDELKSLLKQADYDKFLQEEQEGEDGH